MGISSPILMDNEILTDITTIFLGFGKMMLNGCEVQNVREERVAEGKPKITEQRTSGYLKRDQLAFLYRLVCSMRNVPRSEYMHGLNADAANAIHACDSSFGQYYDARFHRIETLADAVRSFQTENLAQQRQMAELNKHSDYIKQSYCETVDSFLTMAHKAIERLLEQSVIARENDHDPALKFLRAIKKEHDLQRMTRELAELGGKVRELLKHGQVIGRQIWSSGCRFPAPSPTMFNIVTCPKDGTKLRLPTDSTDLVVACPTCHYRFAYNTACISFESATSEPSQQKILWLRRVWKFLRKH